MFFVAVIVPIRLEAGGFVYIPSKMLQSWDEVRSDYESTGLETYGSRIGMTPADGLNIHGERVVADDGFIVTEKWVPYKPDSFHYVSITLIATGYGEVAFELKGQTKDFVIGHWTSEPLVKAVNEVYTFRIKEQGNVINTNIKDFYADHIQPTPINVSVSATGKAITRSRRVVTYGSKQEAVAAQASSSGVGVHFVTGTSSYWKWEAGITREVVADPLDGGYSITTNDTPWSQIYYNSIFTDGDQSTFVSGETVRLHLKTEGRYKSVSWFIRTPDDLRNRVSPSYAVTDESYRLISNRGYSYIDFTWPGKTGTYEVSVVIIHLDGTADVDRFSITVES